MKQIIYYETVSGNAPVKNWLHSLDRQFRNRIDNRLIRVMIDNYGDCKESGKNSLLELADICLQPDISAGDKDNQDNDIDKAKQYLKEYKSRKVKSNEQKKTD